MDQRKNKRFRVNDGGFARFRSKPAKLGKMIDISRSGLSLFYIDRSGELGSFSEIDLLFSDDAFYIDRVSSKIISNEETSSCYSPNPLKIKRMRLHFEKLNAKQTALLETFIRRYTKVEIALNQEISILSEKFPKFQTICQI